MQLISGYNAASVLLMLVHVSYSERCQFDVRIKQTLLNEGFHRNLTYGLVMGAETAEAGDWWYNSCMVGVEQELPPGVYVNPDELKDLHRFGKLSAFPRNKVDVEATAEHSSRSFVYIIGKVSGHVASLWLPLHARYHQPRQHGGVAVNIVPAPRLHLRCPDERLELCEFRSPPELPYLCNGGSRQKCNWKEISYDILTEEVRWEVPVGDTSHRSAVALATALVVALGSLYLLRAVHRYNRQSAKKNA